MNSNDFDRMTAGLANTTSRRQALKLMAGGILGGAAAATGLTAVTAQRPDRGGTVTGSLVNGTDLGVLSDLVATLTEDGVLVSGFSSALDDTVSGILQIPTSAEGSDCEILFLDLLGLQIEITAIPGAGNLLGNLLCAVSGLLDNGGPLAGLTGLLNNLFRQLGLAA